MNILLTHATRGPDKRLQDPDNTKSDNDLTKLGLTEEEDDR